MAIYIANMNGDWWEHIPNSDSIWILDTESLTDAQLEMVEDGFNSDKFADTITELGNRVMVEVE
jgi:hypothetical protein